MKFIERVRELLKFEDTINAKNGHNGVRTTTIILYIIVVLYLLSPIDFVPELIVHPIVFAFIDDILIFSLVFIITYEDLKRALSNSDFEDINDNSWDYEIKEEVQLSVSEELDIKDNLSVDTSGLTERDEDSIIDYSSLLKNNFIEEKESEENKEAIDKIMKGINMSWQLPKVEKEENRDEEERR